MPSLKEQFLLDPDVVFLNHGSFGATPKPVFAAYQEWQRRFERQPIKFVDRDLPGLLQDARQVLAEYLGADAEDVVYIPNVTFGVNVVARSLELGPGDEVVGTTHEYGACSRVWQYLSQKRGFDYRQQTIPLPAGSWEEMVEQFWRGVSRRTRLIFMSHITSPTALQLPIEAICQKARAAGILTLIDGAHAPGQIPLDLAEIDADFYAGNCHKWLCGPKGSGFLYTRRERQNLIEPLVVGWGWGEEKVFSYGSDYLDYLQWLGTTYQGAYLSVPEAIRFQADHNWSGVRDSCHQLLREAIGRIGDLTGLHSAYPEGHEYFHQMAIAPIPLQEDLQSLKRRLYDNYHVEIPLIEWAGHHYIRLSVQGYNSQADIDVLLNALGALL